jgi:hypothetical protein
MHLVEYSTPMVVLMVSGIKFLVYLVKKEDFPTDGSPHIITHLKNNLLLNK